MVKQLKTTTSNLDSSVQCHMSSSKLLTQLEGSCSTTIYAVFSVDVDRLHFSTGRHRQTALLYLSMSQVNINHCIFLGQLQAALFIASHLFGCFCLIFPLFGMGQKVKIVKKHISTSKQGAHHLFLAGNIQRAIPIYFI